MRKEYEMSKDQLEKIMEACEPVPYIIIGNVQPSSPQENANRAWERLGIEMGFDYMSVEPTNKGDRFFTAEPLK